MNEEQHREVLRPDEQCLSCKFWLESYLKLKYECFNPKHPFEGEHPCEDYALQKPSEG